VSVPRASSLLLVTSLCLTIVGVLLPGASLGADEPRGLYMVALDVNGSGRVIEPSGMAARGRIKARSERAEQVTARLATRHDIKPQHTYESAVTGFSARLSPAEARALAADPKVASVRPARRAQVAAQTVQPGVARVKATGGRPAGDVDADVAVIDTGIGPSAGGLNGVPVPMGPARDPELDIVGGVNCYDDPSTRKVNEAWEPDNPEPEDGWWADTYGHGTHVAGIIGARDNAVGTVGVAPGVRLWSVRVFGAGFGTEADVVCGLNWIYQHNVSVAGTASANEAIEVVNMSLEVDRLNQDESCPSVLADPNGDPIQQGICELVGIGVTVVGAAGNSRENANRWAPGGFDSVISVGAMTDTDGNGWGKGANASCAGYGAQRDDTFATAYSNYGRDIDIVAPGTCVRSTAPSAAGTGTAVMTGTSMAAPHVTGAVARYLALHPGTAPDQVRRVVRAAGRMDWKAKSDPLWSGPADTDPPNRVLDVAALTGNQGIKTWVLHDTLKVARKVRTRMTRVDVQRSGGYGGAVALSASGMPGGSRATFTRSTLRGLEAGDLGTKLRFAFGLAGQQGRFDLGIRSAGSGLESDTRNLRLTVDRVGPRVSGLAPRVRKVVLTKSGGASVMVSWNAKDQVSGVASAKLFRKTGSSTIWKAVRSGKATSARLWLKPGQANRVRVKAKDRAGNTRRSASASARLVVRDSASGAWRVPAGWETRSISKAIGGSILLARGQTTSLSTTVQGKAAAIAASTGPGRGSLQVRVDGGTWHTVSLRNGRAKQRKVVWTTRLKSGKHTIEIQGQSGRSNVDALLFLK